MVKKCKIKKFLKDIEFEAEKSLLNSVKVCFKKKITRGEREKLSKCFKENKIMAVWGNDCVLVK